MARSCSISQQSLVCNVIKTRTNTRNKTRLQLKEVYKLCNSAWIKLPIPYLSLALWHTVSNVCKQAGRCGIKLAKGSVSQSPDISDDNKCNKRNNKSDLELMHIGSAVHSLPSRHKDIKPVRTLAVCLIHSYLNLFFEVIQCSHLISKDYRRLSLPTSSTMKVTIAFRLVGLWKSSDFVSRSGISFQSVHAGYIPTEKALSWLANHHGQGAYLTTRTTHHLLSTVWRH